jgi:hypothetical protein
LSGLIQYINLFSFDYLSSLLVINASHDEKSQILIQIYQRFFQAIQQLNFSELQGKIELNGIISFCHIIRRLPLQFQTQITKGFPIPTIELTRNVPSSISPITEQLTNSLIEEMKKRITIGKKRFENVLNSNKDVYSIENRYDGISTFLYSVDIIIKKNDQILAFIEIPSSKCYHDKEQKVLRRIYHLKEFLYSHDYPHIPLLWYNNITLDRISIQEVVNDILSKINMK